MIDLERICKNAKRSALEISVLSNGKRNIILKDIANSIKQDTKYILKANEADLRKSKNLQRELKDRLILDEFKLKDIANSIKNIISLQDPLLAKERYTRDDGLIIVKQSIPVGVIAAIYESRPNVTVDISCLAIKSGNVAILRGGKESLETNLALLKIIQNSLRKNGISPNAIQYVRDPDRKHINRLLEMADYIDLVIPRGGKKLVNMVSEKAKMKAIFGGIGVCHLYIDEKVEEKIVIPIIENSKTQAPSVCNALDTILIHEKQIKNLLPKILNHLIKIGVEVRLQSKLFNHYKKSTSSRFIKKATENDWGQEFLGLTVSIKSVPSIAKAIDHIEDYSYNHTDAIASNIKKNQQLFVERVNSTAVMINASTRFNDGGQLGLGAEIAISTEKLSPRGPLGLNEITTYKWVIEGQGHIRS
ncbi:MAG: glutamate-5-semialdehyde dehydrogenase [Actinobacteria bacterium]|nr:glutamate-5-semialdehyde dehydrogenase [Actinomycetota bacterium]